MSPNPPPLLLKKDPLQTGYYRIRSFNSNYLLTMSNEESGQRAYVSQQDRKNLVHQKVVYMLIDEALTKLLIAMVVVRGAR